MTGKHHCPRPAQQGSPAKNDRGHCHNASHDDHQRRPGREIPLEAAVGVPSHQAAVARQPDEVVEDQRQDHRIERLGRDREVEQRDPRDRRDERRHHQLKHEQNVERPAGLVAAVQAA